MHLVEIRRERFSKTNLERDTSSCKEGAEWVEQRCIAVFLVGIFAIIWDSEQIRLYALIMLIITTQWFALGLFIPELRILWIS